MSCGATWPARGRQRSAAERATLGVALGLLGLHGLTLLNRPVAGTPPAGPAQALLQLDANSATRAELMLLPRIGPTLADNIIEYRESLRPRRAFSCPEDLDAVRRIGPATVDALRPYLRFTPPDAVARMETHLP